MELIHELGLSANPINFAVFFAYVEKSNDALVALIDIHRSNNRAIDDLKCHELYQRYIEPDRLELLHDGISTDLQHRLSDLLERLSEGKEQISTTELRAAVRNHLGLRNHSESQSTQKAPSPQKKSPIQTSAPAEVTQLLLDLAEMRREAHTDGLTGIANRKAFDESLRDAAMATMEAGECLSMLLIDIDHFKQINDTHGHLAGDQVIRTVAKALRENVKGRDTTARYGGEEFAVILPATTLAAAMRVAENIRISIAELDLTSEIRNEELGKISASIGVATFEMGEPLTRMIERADQALYCAKANGRNCVMNQNDVVTQPITHAQTG